MDFMYSKHMLDCGSPSCVGIAQEEPQFVLAVDLFEWADNPLM